MCGRDGERGARERNIRRLTGWLLAVVFLAGCLAGAVSACAAVMDWSAL